MKGIKKLRMELLPKVTGAALAALAMGGCATRHYKVSDHYDGSEFFSTPRVESLGILPTLQHILWGRDGQWPDKVAIQERAIPELKDGGVCATWIGHATVLIQVGGRWILTDPVWSDRVGPLSFLGPRRISAPGIDFELLPKIDFVLVSHDHYDHLDLPTIRRLERKFHPTFVVPLGVERILESEKISNLRVLDWWETVNVAGQIRISLTPAQHNSGRGLFGHNETLWGGFLIAAGATSVFFAGDTAWGNHFGAVQERFGPVSLALLPIGAYKPQETMRRFHLSPGDAVRAAGELKARLSVPIHHDTFQLTAEDYGEPLRDLRDAMDESGRSRVMFRPLRPGESTCL